MAGEKWDRRQRRTRAAVFGAFSELLAEKPYDRITIFDKDASEDFKEWGLGVQYIYNPNVKFGLNFVKVDWDKKDDDNILRFRTQVSF